MKTLKELKAYLKETAVEIRNKKAQRKGAPYGRVAGLEGLRYDYRHHHIAYCLIRGKEMEEIERKCRVDNYPDELFVKSIMNPIIRHWEKQKKLELEANV